MVDFCVNNLVGVMEYFFPTFSFTKSDNFALKSKFLSVVSLLNTTLHIVIHTYHIIYTTLSR